MQIKWEFIHLEFEFLKKNFTDWSVLWFELQFKLSKSSECKAKSYNFLNVVGLAQHVIFIVICLVCMQAKSKFIHLKCEFRKNNFTDWSLLWFELQFKLSKSSECKAKSYNFLHLVGLPWHVICIVVCLVRMQVEWGFIHLEREFRKSNWTDWGLLWLELQFKLS